MAKFSNLVVDVPAEATVSSGRVYIITQARYFEDRQYNMDSRLTIGWINDTSGKTMNPNSNYAVRYPREFSIAAKGKMAPVTKRCGLYMLSLALSQKNGMYQTLANCCGPENANAIMDFANYSIIFRSNVAKDYPHLMSDQMLYSEKLYSDSWLSELFEKKLLESQQEEFKDKWAKACKERGITNVWLCIDGSNSDCTAENVELAEKGKAKSHKNCNVYGYMYAVDAKTGMPITEILYRGGRVDSKAFAEIQAFLRLYEIKVEGVILDRGFCDISCLQLILDQKLKYIIMMKENTYGFRKMYKEHADEIRLKSGHGVGDGIYAISDECRIFGKYNHKSWITLVYDSTNGVERANHLFDKVYRAVKAANQSLKNNQNAAIDKSVKNYVVAVKEAGSIVRYEINHAKLQEAMDQKGYSAIAADSDYTPAEVLAKYDLRDKSEKQYMILKTQLGGRVSRVHYTEGVRSKMFVAFVASIVRHEIADICKQTGYDLATALREANFLCVQRAPDNTYIGVHNANFRQLELLKAAGLKEADIDYFALEESRKVNQEVHDQIHKAPDHSSDIETDPATRRKRGRPPKKESVLTQKPDDQQKRKPGRPKGSKNKPKDTAAGQTLSKTANIDAPVQAKRRGRPPGSKNKKPAVNARQKRAYNKQSSAQSQ